MTDNVGCSGSHPSRDELLLPPYSLLHTYLDLPSSVAIDNLTTEPVSGGLSCIITRHRITYRSNTSNTSSSSNDKVSDTFSLPSSIIIKTNRPESSVEATSTTGGSNDSSNHANTTDNIARNVGLAREAFFYSTLAAKVLDTLTRPFFSSISSSSETRTTTLTRSPCGTPLNSSSTPSSLPLSRDSSVVPIRIPYCYYSYGDITTGNKLMILEDAVVSSTSCTDPPIDSGLCFGSGSPLNWKYSSDTFKHAQSHYGTGISIASSAFYLAACLHSSYFQDKSLLSYPWLRGTVYYNEDTRTGMPSSPRTTTDNGRKEFKNTQAYATNNWLNYLQTKKEKKGYKRWLDTYEQLKNGTEKDRSAYATTIDPKNTVIHILNDVQWPEYLLQCITLSLSQITWETFQISLTTDKFRQFYTLVHGDYHPGNILVYPKRDTVNTLHHGTTDPSTPGTTTTTYPSIMVVDFENVGIGSGPQDCGQFIISHMDRTERLTGNDKELFRQHYYQHLSTPMKQCFTFDECYQEYVYGGTERWIWLLCLLCGLCPSSYIQYWVHQLSSFIIDHHLDPTRLRMPRL